MAVRRRKVRVHLSGDNPSVDGLMAGRPWRHAGHYVIELAAVVTGEHTSQRLEGDRVLIPREKVVFVQELAR